MWATLIEPRLAENNVVNVTASDYAFGDVPASLPAGGRLTLVNTSDVEVHELVAVRLPDGEERPAAELVALPEAELGALFGAGEPAAVVLAPPGGAPAIPAVDDGTLAEPGRYLLLCAIPVGADPGAYMEAAAASQEGPPEGFDGPPHFTQGMVAELEVT